MVLLQECGEGLFGIIRPPIGSARKEAVSGGARGSFDCCSGDFRDAPDFQRKVSLTVLQLSHSGEQSEEGLGVGLAAVRGM